MLFKMFRLIAFLCVSGLLGLAGCDRPAPTTPTSMIDGLRESMVKDQPVLLWDTMPASWQQDVNGLVHEFGRKVPAEVYDRTMTTMKKIVVVLKDKKQFVLNTPVVKMMMSSMTPTEREDATKSYDALVALGDALVSSDLSTAAGLQQFDMTSFLTSYGPEAHAAMVTLLKLAAAEEADARMALEAMEAIKKMSATVNSESESTAVVTITMPPLPGGMDLPDGGVMPMSKVDDAWVPTSLAMMWPMAMTEAKQQLAQEDMSTSSEQVAQLSMALGMVDTALAHFENAENQTEFDQAVSGIMGLLMVNGGSDDG